MTQTSMAAVPSSPQGEAVDAATFRDIETFLHREACLADESRYSEWEALLDDDMLYWIPLGPGDYDRNRQMSISVDNRYRLSTRVRQLNTGKHHAQIPPSPMRRLLSNIEITRNSAGGVAKCAEYTAFANFVLYELRVQSTNDLQVWAGRIEYRLREKEGTLKMFYKKIMLVNSEMPLPSIAFIL